MAKKHQREKRQITYGSAKGRAENHDVGGFESTALNRPEGVPVFRLTKAGTYRLDIIPYVVGKGNPFAAPGSVYYERTFYVHRNIGPNGDSYTCPKRTFDKRCPICEERVKLLRSPKADKDAIKALNPSERQLFLVKDLNEPDKGIQLWDMSHFLFGKLLDTRVKGTADDEDEENYENFFHLDGGMTLKLTVEEDGYDGRSFYKVTAIDFRPRKTEYSDALLDEVPCLDDIPKLVPFDKLAAKFNAVDEEEEKEDEDKPTKKKPKKKKKEADDDDEEEDLDDDDGGDEEEDVEGDDGEDTDDAEEEEDEDTDTEDDGDDGDDAPDLSPGDTVTFVHKKKDRTGTVKKINTKTGMAVLEVDFQDDPFPVAVSKLTKVEDDDEEVEDDDEEVEDDDEEVEDDDEEVEEPAPKKKKPKKKEIQNKKTKPKKKVEEEEDDEDEDISFDEDEDEEDVPVKNRRR
jgi:hypothetical protein